MTAPSWVAIPGRTISTGGCAERQVARILDLAHRHYIAAGAALTEGAWTAGQAAGNGLLLAAAIVAGVPDHVVGNLYVARFGAPPWLHHRPHRWERTAAPIVDELVLFEVPT